MYKLNPALSGDQVHIQNGKAVNLGGRKLMIKRVVDGVEVNQEIPAATQEDLKGIHESGAKLANGQYLVIKTASAASSEKSKPKGTNTGK